MNMGQAATPNKGNFTAWRSMSKGQLHKVNHSKATPLKVAKNMHQEQIKTSIIIIMYLIKFTAFNDLEYKDHTCFFMH